MDQNDLNHIHDSIFEATGKSISLEQLKEIENHFPNPIVLEAAIWGYNDTLVRELVYDWAKRNEPIILSIISK